MSRTKVTQNPTAMYFFDGVPLEFYLQVFTNEHLGHSLAAFGLPITSFDINVRFRLYEIVSWQGPHLQQILRLQALKLSRLPPTFPDSTLVANEFGGIPSEFTAHLLLGLIKRIRPSQLEIPRRPQVPRMLRVVVTAAKA